MEKNCEFCGKVFNISTYLSNVRRHCSKECKQKSNQVELTCKTCGKKWKTWKSQISIKGRPGAGQFCSKFCADEQKRKDAPVKKEIKKRLPSNISCVCEVCKFVFKIYPSRIGKARFCSIDCKGKSAEYRNRCSEQQQAEKHWRWTGGVYKNKTGYVRVKRVKGGVQSIRFEHTKVMLEWILEEDPNHIFLVESDGLKKLHSDLEVHHIDRNRSNNSRNNLLIVTKKAHAQIHHRGTKPKPWECWPSNPERW